MTGAQAGSLRRPQLSKETTHSLVLSHYAKKLSLIQSHAYQEEAYEGRESFSSLKVSSALAEVLQGRS